MHNRPVWPLKHDIVYIRGTAFWGAEVCINGVPVRGQDTIKHFIELIHDIQVLLNSCVPMTLPPF